MDNLPKELVKHIYSFSNTKELTKSLLINKFQHPIVTAKLNSIWPVDSERMRLIMRLCIKTRAVIRLRCINRGYSNRTRLLNTPTKGLFLYIILSFNFKFS